MYKEQNILKSKFRGIFFSIDGPNGSGKSTLIENVISEIKKVFPSYRCYKIREPSDSDIGKLIRKYSEKRSHKYTLLYLVAADRQYNHAELIEKKIHNPQSIIISDRYITSSFVYQIMHGLNAEDILTINYQIYVPDIIFLLKSPNDEIKNRLLDRGSDNLFENPENVEVESTLFMNSIKILEPLGYKIDFITNEDIKEATDNIFQKVKTIIEMKNLGYPNL